MASCSQIFQLTVPREFKDTLGMWQQHAFIAIGYCICRHEGLDAANRPAADTVDPVRVNGRGPFLNPRDFSANPGVTAHAGVGLERRPYACTSGVVRPSKSVFTEPGGAIPLFR